MTHVDVCVADTVTHPLLYTTLVVAKTYEGVSTLTLCRRPPAFTACVVIEQPSAIIVKNPS